MQATCIICLFCSLSLSHCAQVFHPCYVSVMPLNTKHRLTKNPMTHAVIIKDGEDQFQPYFDVGL